MCASVHGCVDSGMKMCGYVCNMHVQHCMWVCICDVCTCGCVQIWVCTLAGVRTVGCLISKISLIKQKEVVAFLLIFLSEYYFLFLCLLVKPFKYE